MLLCSACLIGPETIVDGSQMSGYMKRGVVLFSATKRHVCHCGTHLDWSNQNTDDVIVLSIFDMTKGHHKRVPTKYFSGSWVRFHFCGIKHRDIDFACFTVLDPLREVP